MNDKESTSTTYLPDLSETIKTNYSSSKILVETKYCELRYLKNKERKIKLQQKIIEVYHNGEIKKEWKDVEVINEGE